VEILVSNVAEEDSLTPMRVSEWVDAHDLGFNGEEADVLNNILAGGPDEPGYDATWKRVMSAGKFKNGDVLFFEDGDLVRGTEQERAESFKVVNNTMR
jgi:hypothetical protein